MPTATQILTYPFDASGLLSSNLITGEQQTLTAASFLDFHFVVPKQGPYFADSLSISFKSLDNQVRTLVTGIDYYPTHWFISASRACAKPIYGSITFLDLTMVGIVTLQYQTIGGDWVINEIKAAELLADRLHNPRTTSWEVVNDLPYAFPPIDHAWDLVDMVGEKEVVESINSLETAIRSQTVNGLPGHLANTANPHATTAGQVGAYTKAEVDAFFVAAYQNMQTMINNALSSQLKTDGLEDELFFLNNSM